LISLTAILTNAISILNQRYFYLSYNPLLCLSLPPICLFPQYVLPVYISHKYSADLMFDHH